MRLIKIVRKSHIPRFVDIDGFKCKIWYKDQPLECDVCHQGHKANVCPLKGKCLWCHQDGHFVAECPNPTWNRDVSAAAAPNASVADNSAAPSSDVGPIVSNTSSMDVDEVAPPSIDVCGVSTPVAPPPAADVEAEVVDQRDNQLDELSTGSQPASQSVLAGLSVVVSSATMECSEDGLSQVDPPSGFSDCSPLQPSDGPSSSPSVSPMDFYRDLFSAEPCDPAIQSELFSHVTSSLSHDDNQ